MTRYRTNAPRFVDESVDGEALIMDMVTGTYYTCMGAATLAWDDLKRGVDQHEVAAMLTSVYELSPSDVERDLERFVGELLKEELKVPGTDGAGETVNAPAGPTDPYEPMELDRYTDLADLILLDPVHDVSGAAWPSE